MITVWITSITLFVAYVTTVLSLFGIPRSLSESFYLFESRRKGLGYVFTGWCWVMAILVMFMMAEQSEGCWWQFLSLFAGGGLGMVGTAPLFKGHERVIHYVSAGVCALSACAWVTLAGCWYVQLPLLVIAFALGGLHSKFLFWVETALFLAMFITLKLSI
jgi:hypothetical protein